MDHLYRNAATLRSVVNGMKPFKSDTILLVVANPVDLLTSLAKELSGLPPSQVLGSGTFLDSVRLRGMLADEAKVCCAAAIPAISRHERHKRANRNGTGRTEFHRYLRPRCPRGLAGGHLVFCHSGRCSPQESAASGRRIRGKASP